MGLVEGGRIVVGVRFMASGSCWRARRAKEGEGETWENRVELLVWPISVCVLGGFGEMYMRWKGGGTNYSLRRLSFSMRDVS